MRNPKWHRDEIILALELYFDKDRGPIDKSNPKIIKVSEAINKLPIFAYRPDEQKFRNPNGVTLKLSNFLAIDPDYPGKGMTSTSRLDREVFNEFYGDRSALKRIASEIRAIIYDDKLSQEIQTVENDEYSDADSILEGQVLYRLHKVRERNTKVVQQKKRSVLEKTGKLECEVCEFDFQKKYGELGLGYIECHHIIPLSQFQVSKKTKLEDLALVCSNCHRMLHKSISTLGIAELKAILN